MSEIEKNIPMPAFHKSKYKWGEMEIGDSILVKGNCGVFDDWKKMDSAKAASRSFGKRHGMKFRTMQVDTGVRIWRIL